MTLNVKELNVWATPAPFEIPASEEPDTPDVLQAYREYVLAERADELPCLFQLFSGNLPSFSTASLAYASQACNGTSMQRLFGTTTFPAGAGSLDVILSARGLGRNLGAATNTTDPSVMAATITGSTPLLFLPESITAIANRLDVGDCWAPVVVEGEGEITEGETTEGEGEAQPTNQSADINLDFVINLFELLRVVQIYNSQGLHCGDANSEDGFVPGSNINLLDCPPHTSDFAPQNWVISLSELLQLIQLYNADGYETCVEPEGFCPLVL